MILKNVSIFILVFFGVTLSAYANEVLITKEPASAKVVYQIVHQNNGGTLNLSAPQTLSEASKSISIDLNGYDLAGLVIVSVNGHPLPASVSQFNQPKQCSMTTDKTHPTATLSIVTSKHTVNCSTFGGIFG